MMTNFFRLRKALALVVLSLSLTLVLIACSNNTIRDENDSSLELQTESVTGNSDTPQDSQGENTNDLDLTPLDEDYSSIEEDTTLHLQDIPVIQPYTFTYQEQEFEIIPFYEEILEFIKLAREGSTESLEKLYADTVLVPLRMSSGWSFDYHTLLTPTSHLDKLEEYTHQLIHNADQINETIIDAIKKSADVLSGESKKRIYLFPFHPDQDYNSTLNEGVGGFASTNTILIFINPLNYSEEMLKYIAAHEYHHTIHFEMTFRTNPTLLESMIIEGKADTFAEMIYPETEAPWTVALTPDKEEYVWSIMVDLLDKSRTIAKLSVDFFNGDPYLGIPYWSDYKIGYQIMQDFIKNNPDVSIEEWTQMNAVEILELSLFEERFED